MELRRSPSGPLANVGGAAICYRPGLASDGPNVATWAEIEAAIEGADGFITVYVDDTNEAATVPADSDIDCQGRTVFLGAANDAVTNLVVENGGVIRNPFGIGNLLTLSGAPTTTPFLAFDGASPEFHIENSELEVTGGSQPAINVANGGILVILMTLGAVLGDGTHAAVNVANGGTFEALGYTGSGINAESVSGGVSSAVVFATDDTSAVGATFGALSSTPQRQRVSTAARCDPSAGATGSRPAGVFVATGQMYFDTTIGKPVWWTGATWVLATGVPG